jgi:organic radical activating enzyme
MIDKCYLIPIQKKCNCNCFFCISKKRHYNKKEEILNVNKVFLNNIKLLQKRGIKKIEITGGGEPFLHPNLQEIINIIKNNIPDSYIKLYTNGFILKPICNIDELNISVTHYDSNINNNFMNSNNDTNLIERLNYFREILLNEKIRLSIPIIKGGIDNEDKLKEMISMTNNYVDEYVVRTLYPNTENKEDYFADFDYNNKLVKMEKDNDISDFDGLILWSDNKFYKDWQLLQERPMYTYLLLKPDSQTYINEVINTIYKNNFKIKKVYKLDNFKEQALNLYKDKTSSYLELVKKHLEYSAYLFGNNSLVLILDKDISYEQLARETLELKEIIRKQYSFTHSVNGYLKVNNDLLHLNMVHTPDSDINIYDRDINVLNDMMQPINNHQLKLVYKYRSYDIR